MRKLFAAICVMVVMSAGLFASGKYNGDIQIHTGLNLTDITMRGNFNSDGSGTKEKTELKSKEICFDLETWHMWNINDFFSVGGMFGLNGGFGKMRNMLTNGEGVPAEMNLRTGTPFYVAMIIGPSVGFRLGNVVKLNLAIGPATNIIQVSNATITYESDTLETTNINYSFGFGFELQAKFFPNSPFSPVIGYRFTYGVNDKTIRITKENGTQNGRDDLKMDYVLDMTNSLYVGFSFNW